MKQETSMSIAPDINRLRATLLYDQDTGKFYSLRQLGLGNAPRLVGSIGKRGYAIVCFEGHRYTAHRLAWFYVTGQWPELDIDHINGVRHDNRFCNLRAVTRKQNRENTRVSWSSSGFRGVSWSKSRSAWVAKVGHNGRQLILGYFADKVEAAAAAKAGRDRLFTHHTN
jgi:hypothetical protein